MVESTGRLPIVAALLRDLDDVLTVAAMGRPDRAVTSVVINDETDSESWPADAVVLAVGVRDNAAVRALIDRNASSAAAIMVLRNPVQADPALFARAADAGTTIATAPEGMPWHQITTLVTNSIGGNARLTPGIPGGDLFGMANVICSLIDAPVTIEDGNATVIAFSDRQDEADFIRRESILGRRTPDPFFAKDIDRGALERIRQSARPVFLEAMEIPDGRVALPRVAVAIRAGTEMLGTIWAVVRGPITPEQEQSLWEASHQVALHLLELRAKSNLERSLASRLGATALGGGPDGIAACARLSLTAPCLVAAIHAPSSYPDLAQHESAQLRISNLLATHLAALYPSAVVSAASRTVYAIVPLTDRVSVDDVVRVFRTFVERGPARGVAAAIGHPAQELTDLPFARASADRSLRVALEEPGREQVVWAPEVETKAMLLELRDIFSANRIEPSTGLRRLLEHDAGSASPLIPTLSAWLDAHGDVAVASRRLGVHQNTFRYRIRRVREVADVDLDESLVRLGLQIELVLYNR